MELLTGKILAFVMILTRISAFFAVVPVFSWQHIPVRIKLGLAVILSAFIAAIIPSSIRVEELKAIEVTILLLNESIYGLAIGLICMCIFAVVKIAATIAERQMGLNMSQILDPLTGEQGQPVSLIVEMIFILMFLAVNGHHLFLMTITRSFESFPIGNTPSPDLLLEGILQSSILMLTVSLKLSAPILAAFLFILVVLAIFARIAPEMNILFISMPIRVGIGMFMVALFLPVVYEFLTMFTKYLDKFLPV